jgi:hypothetical protein
MRALAAPEMRANAAASAEIRMLAESAAAAGEAACNAIAELATKIDRGAVAPFAPLLFTSVAPLLAAGLAEPSRGGEAAGALEGAAPRGAHLDREAAAALASAVAAAAAPLPGAALPGAPGAPAPP